MGCFHLTGSFDQSSCGEVSDRGRVRVLVSGLPGQPGRPSPQSHSQSAGTRRPKCRRGFRCFRIPEPPDCTLSDGRQIRPQFRTSR